MDDLPQQLPEETKIEPICGVAANIVKERPYGEGGKEIRRGTPKFHAGAKVYIADVFWGMGGESLMAVGRYRGKYKYIACGLRTEWLENFRVELIYSPTVMEHIQGDGSPEAKAKAENLAASLTNAAEYFRNERKQKREKQNVGKNSDDAG
jgi:hypothetical protein